MASDATLHFNNIPAHTLRRGCYLWIEGHEQEPELTCCDWKYLCGLGKGHLFNYYLIPNQKDNKLQKKSVIKN